MPIDRNIYHQIPSTPENGFHYQNKSLELFLQRIFSKTWEGRERERERGDNIEVRNFFLKIGKRRKRKRAKEINGINERGLLRLEK